MPPPRDLHARSAGTSLASPWLIAVLLIAAAWWTLDLAVLRGGVAHPSDDHWEDLVIARHLASGGGFRTHVIYPPLWGLRDPRTLTIPVLVHGPLLPLLSVPVLAVFGPNALDSFAPVAALCALLALIPIFRTGARHFGAPIGAAAAGLFTLSPLTLAAVHHSSSVVLGAALIAWTVDLVARERPRQLAAGLVAGISYLARPETLMALPLLAGMAGFAAARASGARWPARGASPQMTGLVAAATLAGAFAVIALPWWIHHARVVGSPLFSLSSYTLIGFWGARPDVTVMQDFALTPDRWPAVMRAEWPGMTAKWIAFFPHAVKNALFTPSGATGWLVPIGLIAALVGFARPRSGPAAPRTAREADPAPARRFAAGAALLALIPVASMTLTAHQRLYLMPFAPLFAIGAALGASVLVRAMPAWAQRPRAWNGMLVLLVLPSALPALTSAADEARVLERRLATEREAIERAFVATAADSSFAPLAGTIKRGSIAHPHAPLPRLVFSDTPDFVAWVTGVPAVWVMRDGFERLYPAAGGPGEAQRFGLPPRAQVAGWFHGDFRDPSSTGEVVRPSGTDSLDSPGSVR